jgi:hypothetical protein
MDEILPTARHRIRHPGEPCHRDFRSTRQLWIESPPNWHVCGLRPGRAADPRPEARGGFGDAEPRAPRYPPPHQEEYERNSTAWASAHEKRACRSAGAAKHVEPRSRHRREFAAGSEQVNFLLHPTGPGRPSVLPTESSIPRKALTQKAEDPLGIEEVPGGDAVPPPPSIVRPGSPMGRKPSGQRRRKQFRGCDTRRLSFRMRAGTARSLFPLPDVVGDEFG